MGKTRILVVDDEISIVKFVRAVLKDKGYEVLTATNGAEAVQTLEKELPNLVILDIMMPKMDGFDVCRRLREWSQVPIIMLSARGDEQDKVKCLDLGADDYITKPFGEDELLARVRAMLRRTEAAVAQPPLSTFTSGDLKISFAERRVTIADKEVKLTPTEYDLLQEFVINAGKVLTYTYLLQKVWGPEYGDEHQYLHVFIGRLRKQIEPDPEHLAYIITVPGVGYRFKLSDNIKDAIIAAG
jgi:two-component system KDP operon response regulator KdpE